MAVKLTFHGGVNTIGGNAVLLEDSEYKVKVFLDYGFSLSKLKVSITPSQLIHPDIQ